MTTLPTTTTSLRWPARAGVALVRFYQHWLRHLKPATCRYHPSCSEYAARAIATRGLVRGGLLAAWRILRCNPFSAGGYDPGPWEWAEGTLADPAGGQGHR